MSVRGPWRSGLEPMAEEKQEPQRPGGIWQRGSSEGGLELPGQGGGGGREQEAGELLSSGEPGVGPTGVQGL